MMKKLVGVSIVALGLASCGGGEPAPVQANDSSWWGWADPNSWFETAGPAPDAPRQVEGRAVPAQRLPNEPMETGHLPADEQNAQYADDVRGSERGTVGGAAAQAGFPQPGSDQPDAVATQNLQSPSDLSGAIGNDAVVNQGDQLAEQFPAPQFGQDLNGDPNKVTLRPPSGNTTFSGVGPSGSFDDAFANISGRSIDSSTIRRSVRVAQPAPVPVTPVQTATNAPRWGDLQFDNGPAANAAPAYPQQTANLYVRPAPQPAPQPTPIYQPAPQPQPVYQPAPQPQPVYQQPAPQPTYQPVPEPVPVPAQSGQSVVQFNSGSSSLSSEDRKAILRAAIAQKERGGRIRVIGNAADPSQDATSGLSGFSLSLERANAVASALMKAGVASSAVIVEARGVTGRKTADIYVE